MGKNVLELSDTKIIDHVVWWSRWVWPLEGLLSAVVTDIVTAWAEIIIGVKPQYPHSWGLSWVAGIIESI